LTEIQCVQRVAEIKILGKLIKGDEYLSDLWELWFQERGPDAAITLYKADRLINEGPSSWKRAEIILRSLIEKHSVSWAEPLNRLATLAYLQGKMDESEALCKMVLAVKPWHFGALSGIVLVYVGMNDSQSAFSWANRRLPSFIPNSPNVSRIAWVRDALKEAKQTLLNTEEHAQLSFGDHDVQTFKQNLIQKFENEDDNNAWQ